MLLPAHPPNPCLPTGRPEEGTPARANVFIFLYSLSSILPIAFAYCRLPLPNFHSATTCPSYSRFTRLYFVHPI